MVTEKNHAFLHDCKHFPPLDNQGEVTSCYSQAFTYIQFTNAVSRKINNDNWDPSAMPSACFAPRFTYLLARSSPDKIYEFIKDHGCLTLDRCSFLKDKLGGSIEFEDGKPIKESVAWNIEKGALKSALKYRLSKFKHLSIDNTKPEILIKNIKESIDNGNVVIATTSLENWIMSQLKSDCGKYGQKGDTVVVASRRYIPSGHSFAIVGYDDDITVDFAGESFKGAFLITCGYGDVWQNKGYNWMLYDAIYPISEYESMNNKSIYGGKMCFTIFHNSARVFSPLHLSDQKHERQNFLFIPKVNVEINRKKITAYYIQDAVTKKYICCNSRDKDECPTLVFSENNSYNSLWCIVLYKDLVEWDAFESKYNSFYNASYWIFSLDLYLNDPKSKCFFDSGLNFYDVGRTVGLSRFNNGNFPSAKSWNLSNVSISTPFISPISVCSEYEKIITRRTYSLKDFWFYDWKADIDIGIPQLMVDIELETVDRESFQIKLLRYDKNGNEEAYIPSLFRIRHTQYVSDDDYMSFSGEINSKKPEVGCFTFQYSELLELDENTIINDYTWGVEVIAVNKHSVKIINICLVNNNHEVLSTINLSDTNRTLSEESIKYIFL